MSKYLVLALALLMPSTAGASGLGSVACIAARDSLLPYGLDISCSYVDSGNNGYSYVVVVNNGQSLVNPMQAVGMIAAVIVSSDDYVPTRSDYLIITNPKLTPAMRWRMADIRACTPMAKHSDAMFVGCIGGSAQTVE